MTIKGTVSRIFAEKDSGFKVLVLEVEDMRNVPLEKRNPDFPNNVTVVGMLGGVEQDYVLEVSGEWENRPKGSYWPWQWKALNYLICEFETPKLMRKFLTELPGVGAELANRIQRLYPNTQDIIENHPEKLTVIRGIDHTKALAIQKEFILEKEKKSLSRFLGEYGLKSEEISKIGGFYGTGALQAIKTNPYCMCNDRFVSFKISDRIAKDLGFAADAFVRLGCAVRLVLSMKAGAKGHTFLTLDILLEDCNDFFRENAAIECSFSKEQLENSMHNLIAEGEIIFDSGRFYHPDRYANEKDTAEIFLRRTQIPSKFASVEDEVLEKCMEEAQRAIGIRLDEVQLNAVKTAIHNTTTVITGGPGSGKSATRFCVK